MPSRGRSLSFGQVSEVFCTQNDTSGGSSDTGTKVLAANPMRIPSTSAAMAMTPDGKWPNASRSDVGLRSVDRHHVHLRTSACGHCGNFGVRAVISGDCDPRAEIAVSRTPPTRERR